MNAAIELLHNEVFARIRKGGYKIKADDYKKHHKQKFNELCEQYKSTNDDVEEEVLFDELVLSYASVKYGGMDPKVVPSSIIKHVLNCSVSDSPAMYKSLQRVKNANTGIRAKCITCMGGQPNYVRSCSSITCPLWPFRMGGNPFYGRLTDIDTEAEVVEDYEEEEAFEHADKEKH